MADFTNIVVQGLEDTEVHDIHKSLGNYLYYHSTDLKGSELGRKIYFSSGEIDLDDEEKKIIRSQLDQLFPSYVMRQAVAEAIK